MFYHIILCFIIVKLAIYIVYKDIMTSLQHRKLFYNYLSLNYIQEYNIRCPINEIYQTDMISGISYFPSILFNVKLNVFSSQVWRIKQRQHFPNGFLPSEVK